MEQEKRRSGLQAVVEAAVHKEMLKWKLASVDIDREAFAEGIIANITSWALVHAALQPIEPPPTPIQKFLALKNGDWILDWELVNSYTGPDGCTYIFERGEGLKRERKEWRATLGLSLADQAYSLAYAMVSSHQALVQTGNLPVDLMGSREDFVRIVEDRILKSFNIERGPKP